MRKVSRGIFLTIVALYTAGFYGASVSLPRFLDHLLPMASTTWILNGLALCAFWMPLFLEGPITKNFTRPRAVLAGSSLLALGIFMLPFELTILPGLALVVVAAAFVKPAIGSYQALWRVPVVGALFVQFVSNVAAAVGPIVCRLAVDWFPGRREPAMGVVFLVAVVFALGAFFLSLLLPDEKAQPFQKHAVRLSYTILRPVLPVFVGLIPLSCALQQANSTVLQVANDLPLRILGMELGAEGSFALFSVFAGVFLIPMIPISKRWPEPAFWLGVMSVGFAFLALGSHSEKVELRVLFWMLLGLGESLSLPAASGLFVSLSTDTAEQRQLQALYLAAIGIGFAAALPMTALFDRAHASGYFMYFAWACLTGAVCRVLHWLGVQLRRAGR